MEGFLRRLKDAHAKEREAQSQPALASEAVSRRDFFRRYAAPAAASVALASMPAILNIDTAEAAPQSVPEGTAAREANVEGKVALTRRALNTPEVLEARSGKGPQIMARVFRALQFQITPQEVKGTKYDMEMMRKKYCTQMTYEWQGDNKPYLVRWIMNRTGTFKTDKQAGYGNGVFFGAQNRFLTARHVECDAQQHPRTFGKRDLSWLFTGEFKATPERVLMDDSTLSNAHIDGAYVSVEGVDPDATGDSDGYKSYPGVAMRCTREFIDTVFPKMPKEYRELMSRSFLMSIPAGEGTGAQPKDKPGGGMSGAPVFTIHNGNKVLAGTMFLISSEVDPENGKKYDFAFFHGIEEIREQIQEQLRSAHLN